MKNRYGFGLVVRNFGRGVIDALTLMKEPLLISKESRPELDVQKLQGDIKRAGEKTLRERQLIGKASNKRR